MLGHTGQAPYCRQQASKGVQHVPVESHTLWSVCSGSRSNAYPASTALSPSRTWSTTPPPANRPKQCAERTRFRRLPIGRTPGMFKLAETGGVRLRACPELRSLVHLDPYPPVPELGASTEYQLNSTVGRPGSTLPPSPSSWPYRPIRSSQCLSAGRNAPVD